MMTEQTLQKYEDTYSSLENDRLSLEAAKRESEQEASSLQGEAQLLLRRLQEQEIEAKSQAVSFQQMLDFGRNQRGLLLQEKQTLGKELEHLERLQVAQEKDYEISAPLPERAMVFKGHVEDEEETLPGMLTVVPHIRYPLSGGSALITFENPEVARRIIAMENHQIQLDEWSYICVKAKPMELLLPSSLKIALEQSPKRVLVSGLVAVSVPEEQLLDKLELFFSKRQNKGGEVDHVERLSSGHVALTFVEDGVAERLVQRGQFQVSIEKETHEVKLSRYMSGEIADLQNHLSVCARTVLLLGIPDVLEEELMREALEIHFQKPSKGGGEVEAVAYVRDGHCAIAVFESEEE